MKIIVSKSMAALLAIPAGGHRDVAYVKPE
jgi:hypothetical protein